MKVNYLVFSHLLSYMFRQYVEIHHQAFQLSFVVLNELITKTKVKNVWSCSYLFQSFEDHSLHYQENKISMK